MNDDPARHSASPGDPDERNRRPRSWRVILPVLALAVGAAGVVVGRGGEDGSTRQARPDGPGMAAAVSHDGMVTGTVWAAK